MSQLRIECPVCHATVEATMSDGKIVVGHHADDRGGDCDGWGKPLDKPRGFSLSENRGDDDDNGGFGGGLSDF